MDGETTLPIHPGVGIWQLSTH